MAPLNQLLGDLLKNFGLERIHVDGTGFVPNFSKGIRVSGANVSSAELAALDVTAGTQTASKAVVLDADKEFGGGKLSRFVHSIIAASTSNAATELTAFSNGTVTLPVLEAGDRVRIRAAIAIPTGAGTTTFRYTVAIGGQIIIDSTALANATADDYHVIDAEFVLRTVHASTGTGYVSGITSGVADESAYTVPIVGAVTSLASNAAMAVVVSGVFGAGSQSATLQLLDISVN